MINKSELTERHLKAITEHNINIDSIVKIHPISILYWKGNNLIRLMLK